MKNPRCEPRPILIALTVLVLLVATLAVVIVVPAVVAVLVGGIPEPRQTSLLSGGRGHSDRLTSVRDAPYSVPPSEN